jgi:hypothetical protein
MVKSPSMRIGPLLTTVIFVDAMNHNGSSNGSGAVPLEAVKESLHDQHRQECLCHNLRELNGFRVAQAFLPVLVFDFFTASLDRAGRPRPASNFRFRQLQ